jgi:hypothetical protein
MFRLRKLGTRHLDLEITSDRNVDIRVVGRPGVWMDPERIDRLLGDMRAVVAQSLGGKQLDYGVFADRRRLDRAIITVLYEKKTRRPVAFNALQFMPVTLRGREEEVLHLGLAIVTPDFRGKSLSWALYGLTVMLAFFHRQLRPMWISSVSQVPSVVGLVADGFANVYPSPRPGTRRSYAHLVIARQIMKQHRAVFGVAEDAGFDANRFVITDAYTGGSDHLKKTFDDAMKHRDETVNEFCRRDLDYRRGDDFLQIGQYNLFASKRYLLRAVPRASLPSVFYHVAFLAVGTLILPVVHWFSASTPMGALRPWRT